MTTTTAPAASARYRDVFGVPEFRTLFLLQTLRVAGDSVRMIALSVQAFERTGSSLTSALVFCAEMLPYVVGGAFLLSLADRIPMRRLLTGFQLLSLAVTAVLACDVVPLPGVIALILLLGLFGPVNGATVQGRLPALLPGDGFVLGRSLFTMTAAGAQIAGQAVGGLLLAALTPSGTLWLSAGSAAVAAALARFGLPDVPAPGRGSSGVARETWRVNRRLLGCRGTRGLLLAYWLPLSLAVGAEGLMVPYASGLGRAGEAGLLLSSGAVGMFAGNLLVGRWIRPGLRDRLTLPLAMLTGAPLLLFALHPPLPMACALMLAGALGLGYDLPLQRRLVNATPERIHGQAMGLANTGMMTGQAAGMAAAGALGDVVAPPYAIAVCGAAAVTAALALSRHLRPARGDSVPAR